MDYCNQCGGTGKAINGEYCKCSDGRLQKRIAAAETKAAARKKDEAEQEAKDPKAKIKRVSQKPITGMIKPRAIYEVGEWVTIVNFPELSGSNAFILQPGVDKSRVNIIHNSRRFSKMGWIDNEHLTYPNYDMPEDHLRDLIDLSIALNQKEWFLELTAMLPKRKRGR